MIRRELFFLTAPIMSLLGLRGLQGNSRISIYFRAVISSITMAPALGRDGKGPPETVE
jgi:hypothetical protein